MSEETAVATPSVAQESTATTFELPRSGTDEYAKWRVDGTLPEKKIQPAPADSTPAPDDAADSAATNAQEPKPGKRKPDVEARFKEYSDRIKALEKDLEEARRPKTTQAEPSPAKPVQQPQAQQTRPKPTAEDKNQDGTAKFKTYEDFVEELADWKAEQRWAASQREQQAQSQKRELDNKVSEARTRYGEKFDEILQPTVNEIVSDQQIPMVVKSLISESDVLPDLIYVIGSDPQSKAEFLQMARTSPGKALRYVASLEAGIIDELSQGKESGDTGRNERGQFTSKPEPEPAPAKRGPESAPEPPIEIGNRGSGPMDESERALKAAQRGNSKAFRDWKAAEDAKELRRRRGA